MQGLEPIASPLLSAGGVLRARLLDDEQLAGLQEDARSRATCALPSVWKTRVPPANREPDHWYDVAAGGDQLTSFYRGERMRDVLAHATGTRMKPEFDRGAYSYYRRPGHYLDVHRDRKTCTVAVITCLHLDPGLGGELVVYPGRCQEPIEWIQRTPSVGGQWLRLAPGDTVIIAGWLVPHRVRLISSWRTRIVTALCFQPER